MRVHDWPIRSSEDENVIDWRDRSRCYEVASEVMEEDFWRRREDAILIKFVSACKDYDYKKRERLKEERRLAQLEREKACPQHLWELCVDFGEIKIECSACGMNLLKNEDPKYKDIQGFDAEVLAGSVPIDIEIEGSHNSYWDSREDEIYVNIRWRNHPQVRRWSPESEERWLQEAMQQAT